MEYVNKMQIYKRYLNAKEVYKNIGVDVDEALDKLKNIKLSIHCWQGDDVHGFEDKDSHLTGGISVTGNYPGKARNPEELRMDLDKAFKYIPGKHKVNLHAIYLDTNENVERSDIEPKHFEKWVNWAKERGLGLDFNPTLFSHPMVKYGLTLSSPDEEVREYWIKHCIASRKIGEYFGKELNQTCLNNLWIGDGLKDNPTDRLGPRLRLKDSLDRIYSEKIDEKYLVDSVESKLFGIGLESYTVGSHEFYMNYTACNDLVYLLDNGHFHKGEKISDKISSILAFNDKIALHLTRAVHWDSDHVILLDDELREITQEIVRNDALDKVMIGLDYFDASINRIAAWVVGSRNVLKAFLLALLMPNETLKVAQDKADYTKMMVLTEEAKTYPFSDIWNYYCYKNNVPINEEWYKEIITYEKETQLKRR